MSTVVRQSVLLCAVVISCFAGVANAQPRDRDERRPVYPDYEYATVLESIPITRRIEVNSPREVCDSVPVEYRRERRSGAGVVLGTLIGAAVGHHVGRHGNHEAAGTVIGAVVGSRIGRDASPREVTVERDWQTRCRTVDSYHSEERVVGYQVFYRYNGRTYETELPEDPGTSLRVAVDVRPVGH